MDTRPPKSASGIPESIRDSARDWDHQIVWNRPKYPENSPNYYDDQITVIRDGGSPAASSADTRQTDNYTNWAIEFINRSVRQ